MDPPPQDPSDLLAKMSMLDSGGKDAPPLVADGKGEEVIIGTYTIPTFKNKGFNGNGNGENHDDDKIRRRRRTREKLKANRMIKSSTSSHEDGNGIIADREQLNKKFSTKNRKESFNNNTMQEDDNDGGRMDSSDDWMENALLNGIPAANEGLSLKQPVRSSTSVERTYTNSTSKPTKQQSSQSSLKRFNRSRSSGAPTGGKQSNAKEHLHDDTTNLNDSAKVTESVALGTEQPRLTTVDDDYLITNPDVSIEDIIKLRRKYNPTTNSSSSPIQEVESCPPTTTDTLPSNISTLPTIKTFKVTKNSPDETAGLFLRKASNGAILVHSLSPNSLFRKTTPLCQGHEVLSVNEKRVNDPKLAATLITQSKKHLSLRVSTFERCKGFFYCQVKRRGKKQQHNVEAGGKVTEEKTTAAASSGASSRRTSRIRTRGSTNNNNNGGVRFVTTSIDGLRRGTGDGLVRVAHIDPDSQFANSEQTKNRLHVGCIILTVNGVPVTNARSALEKVMDSQQLIEVLHCDERVYRDDWVNVGLKQVLSGKIKDPMEIATSTFILDNKKNETDEGSVDNFNDLSMWDLEWETNYKEAILREKKKRGSIAVNTNTSYAFKLIFDNNNGRCHPELVNYSTMMPPTDEFDVSLLVKIVNDLQRAVMTVLQNMLRTTKFDLKFGDGVRRQTGHRTQQKSNLRNIATVTSREQLDAKQPDSPKRRQRIKSWDILTELIEEDYDGMNEELSGNKHKSDIPRRGSADAINIEQKYDNQRRTDKVHEKARQYEMEEQANDTTTNRRLSVASVSGSMFSTEMLDDFMDYLEDVSASLSAAGLDSVSTPSSNSSPSPPSSPRDSNSTQQISPPRENGNYKKSCDDDLAYITGVYRDVSSKYEISDKIVGSGGFGEVRDCVDTSTGALYVVKTILKPDPSDTTKINLIRNEILLLHEAHHPNIVTLKDLFEDDHYVHIVMERCTGGDLFDMVVRQNPRCFRSLTEAKKHEQRTANCMHSILKVLEYLHSKGIVHRDIKPEHFLLTTDDDTRAEIKLIDFGLARKHTQGTDPMTTFTGSPSFVAPEVIARKYDSQCDMFSVGVTAYFLLTGTLPFDGSTDEETFDLISDGVFSFPSTSLFLSNEAMDFITRLLETNPRKRLTAIKALRHPWIVQVVPI